jgi:hypothetical protein
MEKYHPNTLLSLGGLKDFTLKLAAMYTKRKFSNGIRSQEGIRRVTRTLKTYDQDSRAVKEFFVKEKNYSELPPMDSEKDNETLLGACKHFKKILSNVEELTETEHQELKRTWKVLNQVLYNIS